LRPYLTLTDAMVAMVQSFLMVTRAPTRGAPTWWALACCYRRCSRQTSWRRRSRRC
jgi:hypothetical protein